MDNFLDNFLPGIWNKFFEHIPDDSDLTLIVLKGHLLIEEELNKIIKNDFEYPEAILTGRFSFTQSYRVVMASHFKENRKWLWDSIDHLNKIRNKFAHNLEPKDIDSDISKFMEKVHSNIRTREETLSGQLRHAVAMILSMLYDLRCRGHAI